MNPGDPPVDPPIYSHPAVPTTLFSATMQLRAAILAGTLLLGAFIGSTLLRQPWGDALAWASLAVGMLYGGKAAWDALRASTFDIDVLMVVGAGLAAYIGHAQEGALLLFLFVLSGALEDLAHARTQREITALSKLLPSDALVQRDGAWVHADATSLLVGERVKIRAGERVPADARVVQGETSFDQSAITGESMPRHVVPGDELFAGTINADDVVEAVVLRPARESSVQKILDMVIHAREGRQEVQRTIDRLSQPYSLGVLAVSIAVFLVWWLLLGVPAVGSESQPGALYTAITLLIVGSPCALIISTPTATLSGIARAARAGVLFKSGDCLERLARTGAMCLDKTGTLTFGRPMLEAVVPVDQVDHADDLLAVAAALEADSTHPIAVAIREGALSRGIAPAPVTDIGHTVAKGLEGLWNGHAVRLGSFRFVEPLIPAHRRDAAMSRLAELQAQGKLAVLVAAMPGGRPADSRCAIIVMADALRPGTDRLVDDLHVINVRPVVMLTGDNSATAARVARDVGLDAFHGDLLPADKLSHADAIRKAIAARPADARGVAVVGDGVNDAPALAAADVSLAIGTIGTAAAMENADVVLLTDSIAPIPWAIRLARATRATIRVNLAIALSAIVAMAILTLVGSRSGMHVPLSIGVLAHEGGTLLVVANSLLLLRFKPPAHRN
jgi:Cd2+/Zn2+-exporting ATPase